MLNATSVSEGNATSVSEGNATDRRLASAPTTTILPTSAKWSRSSDTALLHHARYGSDPCAWAKDVLGVELWSRQRDILSSVFHHRRTVVSSGHGVGKTFVSAVAVLAFLYLRRPSIVVTTAPTWRQIRTVLWSEIKQRVAGLSARFGETGITVLDTELRVAPGHFALGLSSDKPDNFQGYHSPHILLVLDEAAGIEDSGVWAAMDSLASTGESHMLAIGNPTSPRGPFHDICRSPEWRRLSVSCFDSPSFTGEPVSDLLRSRLVSKEWVEEKRREWGEESSLWQSRVLGQFPVEGDDCLIPLAWVEAAQRRDTPDNGYPRSLGVDVARFGDDATVYVGRFGNRVVVLGSDHGRDTMQVAGRVTALVAEHRIETVSIDDIGVGGGVTDRLRETGAGGATIRAVNVSEAAVDSEKFANRRAELWWNVRGWVRECGILPDDERVLADLTAPKFRYTSRGQIRLEPKEDTKRRLGRSPDFGDAVMLALSSSSEVSLDWFRASGLPGHRGIASGFPS